MRTLQLLFLFVLSFSLFTACDKEEFAPSDSGDIELDTRAHKGKKTKTYTATLGDLNSSGVSAVVMVSENPDGTLTVSVEAAGLEPNMPHAQHIHGFDSNTRPSTCPDETADTDGDGLVELAEGAPFYGGVLLTLSMENGMAPMSDADGNLSYMRTFSAEEASGLKVLQNREIVMHGATVEAEYWALLPVACGSLSTADIYPVGASGR